VTSDQYIIYTDSDSMVQGNRYYDIIVDSIGNWVKRTRVATGGWPADTFAEARVIEYY